MLLDGNILIYGANGAHPVLDKILDRTDLAVASITRIETIGFHRLSESERTWLQTAFQRMTVLALDDAVASRAIELRQNRKMGLADAIIAATALIHRLPLVTRDEEDFRNISSLHVINPFVTPK